jgi:hypothetical protein
MTRNLPQVKLYTRSNQLALSADFTFLPPLKSAPFAGQFIDN